MTTDEVSDCNADCMAAAKVSLQGQYFNATSPQCPCNLWDFHTPSPSLMSGVMEGGQLLLDPSSKESQIFDADDVSEQSVRFRRNREFLHEDEKENKDKTTHQHFSSPTITIAPELQGVIPIVPELQGVFPSSQSSDSSDNYLIHGNDTNNNNNNSCELPSLLCKDPGFVAAVGGGTTTDHFLTGDHHNHLLDFVMRLTDTPDREHHHHHHHYFSPDSSMKGNCCPQHHSCSPLSDLVDQRLYYYYNEDENNNNNNNNTAFARPSTASLLLNTAVSPSLSSCSPTTTATDVPTATIVNRHSSPLMEHSLFSRSTTTTTSDMHEEISSVTLPSSSASTRMNFFISGPSLPPSNVVCGGDQAFSGAVSCGTTVLDAKAIACRSTLSFASNNTSLTTAVSTPSGSTPTWSQDITTTTGTKVNRALASPSLTPQQQQLPPGGQQQQQQSLLLRRAPSSNNGFVCCTLFPTEEKESRKATGTGVEGTTLEEQLGRCDSNNNNDHQHHHNNNNNSHDFSGSLIAPHSSISVANGNSATFMSANNNNNNNYRMNFFDLMEGNDHDVYLPALGPPLNNNNNASSPSEEAAAASSENLVTNAFQSSSKCKSISATAGLRHLHSESTATTRFIQTAAGGYCDDNMNFANRLPQQHMSSSPSSTSNNYRGGGNGMYDWTNDLYSNNDYRRLNNNPSKGLTDFHSLAYASKRWQNLNVVLPLYIPHGVIAVIRSTGENTYVFSDLYPASQLLFSGTGRLCDMWATYLRLRVAVIHKCPEFLVPRVAQVFNHVLSESLPKFSEPIYLRCAGVVKHTIQLRSSGGLTFRYDTIGQISNAAGQEKMRIIFDGLQKVMYEVNDYLTKEVEEVFRSFQGRDCIQDESNANIISNAASLKCGLEFRFSPCKELKIAIREGTVCDCSGVDSVIAGGGASSMSSWAQQFIVENLIVGELRLERDKTSETQLDPFFLPQTEVKTRMISKDLDGNPARICFVDPALYPDFCRPVVEYAIGISPLQAAEQLVGATHQQLAKVLPNGMSSLTAAPSPSLIGTSTLASLNRPSLGLQLQPHSVSSRMGLFNDKTVPTAGARPTSFSQPTSSIYSSPNGIVDSSALGCSELSTDPRQDFYSYTRLQQQQQMPVCNVQQQQRHSLSNNKETPIATDATGEALKGLTVLQRMLADLNIHNDTSQSPDTNNHPGPSAAPSSSFATKKSNSQQLEAVLGQAAAAAMGLSRHHEALLKTPEAASLLSQLHSALQKLPYISRTASVGDTISTAAASALLNQQQQQQQQKSHEISPPVLDISPSNIDKSVKQQEQQQQRSSHQPHLAFPHPFNVPASQQRLFDDAEVVTPSSHHEMGQYGGSKSVGATPINYSLTAGGLGSSPNTTMSSASFVHGVGSSIISHDVSPSSTSEIIATGKTILNNHSGASSTVPSSVEDVKETATTATRYEQ